jgi:broad specificity phosphatase PhoE
MLNLQILSIDLHRAVETTDEILTEVHPPVQYAPEWCEMNNSAMAGMPNALAEAHYPGLHFSSLEGVPLDRPQHE